MENRISGHTRMLVRRLLIILMRVKPPHELLLKINLESLSKPYVKIETMDLTKLLKTLTTFT